MKTIKVATKSRGFLSDLFRSDFINIKFNYKNSKVYETNSKTKLFLSNIIKSKAADHLGIIQRIKIKDSGSDFLFSYNRFLKVNKDYVIYLENPLALVHYSVNRPKTMLSKRKLKKYFNDPHLKSIVCLSKACYETLNYFYNIPKHIKIEQIYPMVSESLTTTKNGIQKKCMEDIITCLYISSNFNLKGGKEILLAFKELKTKGNEKLILNIITKVSSLDDMSKKIINENDNINIFEFNFSKEELNKFYNSSNILLNPTRQDSFSLVVLEAMKYGNAILSTDLYAIPEMVKENQNGYLINPMYRFFDYNNLPNEKVWNNRKETIYSDYIDRDIVNFLVTKLDHLNKDRETLVRFSIDSFKRSINSEFGEECIKNKWEALYTDLLKS